MKLYHCIYISFLFSLFAAFKFSIRQFFKMKLAQWIRHWPAVLAASQGGQHPQLEPDVSTVNFRQGSTPHAAKEDPKMGANL